MLPFFNWSALSVGATCNAWADAFQIGIEQAFKFIGLPAILPSINTFCNIIDIGDFSGLLGLLPF